MGARDVQIRIVAFDNASSAFKQIETAAANATRQMQNMGSGSTGIMYNAAGIAAGVMAYNALSSAASAAMNMTLNFSRTMETNEIGIAGILMSMTTLNGETMKWGDAISISKDTMRQLNDEALKTAATSEEMVSTYRGLLGPGLAAKMTMQEIVQLTSVGVNAVKSLGLNNTQLVQELRDLVQGGIMASSSTLATALGLKDKDIKAAKESSEGLFKFLMARMEGFKYSAEATQQTMSGLMDTAMEGITRVGSVGTLPIFNMIKENLKIIGKQFVDINNETKEVTISKSLINDLTEISTKTVQVGKDLAELFSPVATVAVPALKIAGSAVGFIANNVIDVGHGLATWYVLSTIAGMYTNIVTLTSGAVISNSLLGRAVTISTAAYAEQGIVAQATFVKEMALAEGASAAIIAAERAKTVAKKEAAVVAAGIQKADETGNYTLAAQIRGLSAEYIRLGVTAEEAGLMQLQAAKMAKDGNFLLASQLIATREAHLLNAVAAREAQIAQTVGATGAMNAVNSLGKTVFALAGGWVTVAAAIGYAIYKLGEYQAARREERGRETALDDPFLSADGRAQITSKSANTGMGGLRSATERASDAEIAAARPKYDPDAIGLKFQPPAAIDKAGQNLAEQQEKHEDKIRLMIDGLNEKIVGETGTDFEKNSARVLKEIDKMNIELREAMEKGVDTTAASAKIDTYRTLMTEKFTRDQMFAKQETENQANQLAETLADDKQMLAEYVKEAAYIAIDKESLDVYKKTGDQGLADKLSKVKKDDADKKYTETTRDNQLAEINQQLQHNNMLVQLENKTYAEIDALNRQALDSKIAYLNAEIAKATTNKDDRIKFEQEVASAKESLQQISGRNMVTAASEAIRQIKEQQHDYASDMVQTWNDVNSKTSDHFKNMVKGVEGLGDGIKGTIKDISASISDMFIQMAYQQMIFQPLQNWFSGILGGLGGSAITGSGTAPVAVQGPSMIDGSFYKKRAKGGMTSGLTLVGEEGPELINFTNPGMVYTAGQTKNILNAGNQSQSQPQRQSQRPIIINNNISTPDAGSFRQSRGQVGSATARGMQRAYRRNG